MLRAGRCLSAWERREKDLWRNGRGKEGELGGGLLTTNLALLSS